MPEDPLLDTPNFDIASILDTIEKENTMTMMQTSGSNNITNTLMQRQTIKKSPQIPIFQNCKIGTINININKN